MVGNSGRMRILTHLCDDVVHNAHNECNAPSSLEKTHLHTLLLTLSLCQLTSLTALHVWQITSSVVVCAVRRRYYKIRFVAMWRLILLLNDIKTTWWHSLEQNPYLDALLRHRCHCYLTSPCWGWCLSPCLSPVASFTRGCQRKELDFTEESHDSACCVDHALAVCNLKNVLVKDNAFASICTALFQRCWVKWRSVNTNRNGRFATSAALIQNTSIGRTACGVEVATSEYVTPPQPLYVVITTS